MVGSVGASSIRVATDVDRVVRRARSSSEKSRPNILYVLVDDASVDLLKGYQYLGSRMGFGGAPTYPLMTNVTNLVAGVGVKFSNCFTMPVCSSHRASCLTGRYPGRHGCGSVVMAPSASVKFDELGGLWSTEYTIAHLLGDAGYRTLLCGKAHLSLPPSGGDAAYPDTVTYPSYGTGWKHPVDVLGFGEFRGVMRNLNVLSEYPPDVVAPSDGATLRPGFYNFYWNELRVGAVDPEGSRVQVSDVYQNRYMRERLEDWVLNPHVDDVGKPWFAMWNLNVAHSPFGPRNHVSASGCMPPDTSDYVNSVGVWNELTAHGSACAAIENIDVELGKLRVALGDEWDNTMVFFMADNGSDATVMSSAVTQDTNSGDGKSNLSADYGDYDTDVISASPQRLKGSVYTGGTKAALIVSGPLVANGGRVSESLVDSVDLFETFRVIGYGDLDWMPDASVRPRDSVSFYDVLADAETSSAVLRTTSFSQIFIPNGSDVDIVDTATQRYGGGDSRRDYVYRKLRSGSAVSGDDGHWHLLRMLSGTSWVYELYQIDNYPIVPAIVVIDYNEVVDLSGTKAAILSEMQAELESLIVDMSLDPTHI